LIGDNISQIHDKMSYIFDVFNERLLFIELFDKSKQDKSKHYPLCSFEKGSAPQQLLMDQLFGLKDFSNGALLDNNSIAEELFDPDELDELGYNSEFYDDDSLDE